MPVLSRRGDKIGEPVQELKRREFDDAIGPRPRGLAAAAGPDPRGGFVAGRAGGAHEGRKVALPTPPTRSRRRNPPRAWQTFFRQRARLDPQCWQAGRYGLMLKRDIVKAEFTAIIEAAPEGGYWAMCPEIPGANGQGETVEQAKESLKAAIELILEDRREDMLRGLPADAIQATVSIE